MLNIAILYMSRQMLGEIDSLDPEASGPPDSRAGSITLPPGDGFTSSFHK